MKTITNQQSEERAFTLTELLIILVVLAVCLEFVLRLHRITARAPGIACVNNLKQVALAYRLWGQDHFDKFPAQVSVADNGAMEPALSGDLAAVYRVMSNELFTPKILYCPAEVEPRFATNFGDGLLSTNLSYFSSLDATETNSDAFLGGDDNLVGLKPISRGIFELTLETTYFWAAGRHSSSKFSFLGLNVGRSGCGNIASADGNVARLYDIGLNQAWLNSGITTNRLLMP